MVGELLTVEKTRLTNKVVSPYTCVFTENTMTVSICILFHCFIVILVVFMFLMPNNFIALGLVNKHLLTKYKF